MPRRDDSALLALIEERLRWARQQGSAAVSPDVAGDARFILRRWRSGPRRLKVLTTEERARDLVRGFVQAGGGASSVGRLKVDFEWLVEQLVPVLDDLDS